MFIVYTCNQEIICSYVQRHKSYLPKTLLLHMASCIKNFTCCTLALKG